MKQVRDKAWLRLAATPGMGPAQVEGLLRTLGQADEIAGAPVGRLRSAGLDEKTAIALGRVDEAIIERAAAWIAQAEDHHLVPLDDAGYPERLRQIQDPPLVLFVRGDPGILGEPGLAVVGSRNPSPAGADNAHEFACYLSRCGLVITSGLAAGVDAAAHRGALHGGSPTVAVLGSGPDRIYPAANAELADSIAARGALVSEFFPGSPPRRDHFPRRNRIISGLSLGVLVVEAGLRSGSLISARLAGEQGREVFAIPGSIHNPMARGCHRLIKQGAKLVECAEDVFAELAGLIDLEERPPPARDAEEDDPAELSAEQRDLLAACGHDPVTVDQLVGRTQLTSAEVSSMLLILELQGFVESGPGGRYTRVSKRS
jgi:DNA processing protein